jgi:hypothetical protein
MLAAIVEQHLTNVLPHRMRPVELDRVETLYLDRPETSQTRSTARASAMPVRAST